MLSRNWSSTTRLLGSRGLLEGLFVADMQDTNLACVAKTSDSCSEKPSARLVSYKYTGNLTVRRTKDNKYLRIK